MAAAAGSGLAARAAEPGAAPTVRTKQGVLEGIQADGVTQFRGVPFAQPPVGDLRWRAPRPPAAWSGVRPAKAFGPAAYQQPIPESFRTASVSEDCLYLNVWTTSLSKTAKQPVMVWLHGGGNIRGAASEAFTDGSSLAKLGVTVVAPNYRLGAFGFINDEAMGANFGILDMVAALEWVRDNIDAFGGDPSRVMVFGYSSGAFAIRALLQCPKAKGLFHRGVIQSGGGEPSISPLVWSPAVSRDATVKLFQALGTTDPAALRAIPSARLQEAARPLSNIPPAEGALRTPLALTYRPGPDDKVLMSRDFPAWTPGLPIMYASCQNEARWAIDPTKTYDRKTLEIMAREMAGAKAGEALRILDGQGGTDLEKLDELLTTVIWRDPIYSSLRRFDRDGHKVYQYRFARVAPGRAANKRLASHGTDVPYIFGTLGADGPFDEVDRRISREMQHAFIEFARTGVPKRLDGAAWPAFTTAKPQAVVVRDQVVFDTAYRPEPLLAAIRA
jgi:para-nitrobenzyl esterase